MRGERIWVRMRPSSWHVAENMIVDVRQRGPWYLSDWKDAINYRVIPSVVFIFFANILPAIAFAQDMFDRTKSSYGVNEVLMGSAMGGIVFGLFSAQPLCIVGITGPITIFNYTVFEIVVPKGIPYFQFMAWICIWAFVMHTLIAVFNCVRFMRYVTMYSCHVFAAFINIIYIQKGIQILARQFRVGADDLASAEGAYFSIVVSLCVLIFGGAFYIIGNFSPFFSKNVRNFISDYSLPLVVIFFTGFTFFPGRISGLQILRLPTGDAFQPTTTNYGRHYGWFIHFWDIKVGDVFLAAPFAVLLTALFYLDHNISSIMCQGPSYALKKPPGFHWDFFLLGVTTLVAGLLGIPAPNGLIPQAPLHTQSLIKEDPTDGHPAEVVEQRFTNFTQGLLTLGLMTGPLLKVLHLVPQGVLAGLFFMMGVPGLLSCEIVRRICLLVTEPDLRKMDVPLYGTNKKSLYIYMLLSVVGVGGEIAITETIAAVGFPGVIFMFMVLGAFFYKFFPESDLLVLDGPAASKFIMGALDHENGTEDEGSNTGKSIVMDSIY